MKRLKDNNRAHLTKLLLAVTTVQVLLAVVTMFVAFPTDEHRSVNRQLADMVTNPQMADNLPQATPEVSGLAQTAEYQHSKRVVRIGGVVSTIATVSMTYFMYGYIRRRKLSRDAVSAAVVIFVVATVASLLLSMLAEMAYGSAAPVSPPLLILGLLFAALAAMIGTYIVAVTARYFYNRRYGFRVE